MESITTSSYAVHFNDQAFEAMNNCLAAKAFSKIFVLVDENTKVHCLPIFKEQLSDIISFDLIEIKSGEVNKNIDTCNDVWLALSEMDADRKSLLINLGGGVVTELGVFVAKT
jgi:3-dehydroquinate synthase